MSRIIINAMNVHQGGGGVLLSALLSKLPPVPVILFHDARFSTQHFSSSIQTISVPPTLIGRFKAERALTKMATSSDQVFCFGNLPPLFKSKAKVTVYLQNALLLNGFLMTATSTREWLRNTLAALQLKIFCKNVYRIWVQTPTMAKKAAERFSDCQIEIKPFLPALPMLRSRGLAQYDFIYIASLDRHKNHRSLIEAWILLAKEGLFPSLVLNIADESGEGVDWINQQKDQHSLRLISIPSMAHEEIIKYYAISQALIFPSFSESLGLPLLEAATQSVPIIASDLSYVHDVVRPTLVFDPKSPLSIAASVKRFLSNPPSPPTSATVLNPLSIESFWQHLLQP